MRCFRLHVFGFIMYLVLALLKVALVNFTLNEYMMMMMILFNSYARKQLLLSARLSHRNSVRPSVRHGWISKNGAS